MYYPSMENFIYEGYIENLSLCDELVAYFNSNPHKNPGRTGNVVNTEIKKSTDCALEGYLLAEYLNAVQKITNQYVEKFPFCNKYSPWTVTETVNIQHYSPGEGYYNWHTERYSALDYSAARHLVFLTYLNDVTDKGGTEFLHQGVTTTPVKGKTLIWPVDWTYTHRGITSPTQEKYIATGWYSFV